MFVWVSISNINCVSQKSLTAPLRASHGYLSKNIEFGFCALEKQSFCASLFISPIVKLHCIISF